MSRKRKLILNTVLSLLLQITTIICGFILPRLILGAYGSDINGLVNSISQFLSVITLLDMGVGAVVQSALYKPLADNDNKQISCIYSSAQKFFKHVALILLGYIVVLAVIYPFFINEDYDFLFTAFLICAVSISTFAEYYFGIVNRLLITADQKGYIYYILQITTIIVGTGICAVLIGNGASVQLMKLAYSLVFLTRPIMLSIYVRKNYKIDRHITYDEEPIKQKWNGMAQHFAAFVLGGTDVIVLTLFSDLSNVSVYSVYNMVIIGVKNLLLSVTNGFQALLGEMLAKNEIQELHRFFSRVEWIIHTLTTLIFGCTGILIVSFVQVYTYGVDDADYIQPLFAVVLTAANAGHCLRLPYNILILAAGHYKQTQSNYIIAMILNIVISVATVWFWGLIGVAIGTLVAMIYQTVWMAWYDSKNIIKYPMHQFVKHIFVDILIVVVSSAATFWIPLTSVSFVGWVLQAVEVFIIWLVITIFFNFIFYRDNVKQILYRLKK